jgi:hypothetical protein
MTNFKDTFHGDDELIYSMRLINKISIVDTPYLALML